MHNEIVSFWTDQQGTDIVQFVVVAGILVLLTWAILQALAGAAGAVMQAIRDLLCQLPGVSCPA